MGKLKEFSFPSCHQVKLWKGELNFVTRKLNNQEKSFSTGTVILGVVISETTIHRVEFSYYSVCISVLPSSAKQKRTFTRTIFKTWSGRASKMHDTKKLNKKNLKKKWFSAETVTLYTCIRQLMMSQAICAWTTVKKILNLVNLILSFQ